MAIWQAAYSFIPISANGTDPQEPWTGFGLPLPLAKSVLSSVLPEGRSWHSDLVLWGDSERHDVQLWLDKGEIVSIMARIDLREPDAQEIALRVAAAATDLGALLQRDNGEPFEPVAGALLTDLATTEAARFVADPRDYLNSLKKPPGDP